MGGVTRIFAIVLLCPYIRVFGRVLDSFWTQQERLESSSDSRTRGMIGDATCAVAA